MAQRISQTIRGSVVALVTPMASDGSIHWQDLENLIEWHIKSGTHAIVVAGTTGECATFTTQEQGELFERAAKIVNKRVPLIAGTGANATTEGIELVQLAAQAGVDAVLSVVPYYNKPSQEGLYQHFIAQAQASDLPLILYNVPGRTGVDLAVETIVRLAAHPNICGLKDASHDLLRVQHLSEQLDLREFALYSGEDISSLAFMRLGGIGAISVTANVVPKAVAKMCQAALDGHWQKATLIDRSIRHWHSSLFIEASPGPAKWVLHRIGRLSQQTLRLPLVPPSAAAAEVLEAAIQSIETT